MKNFYAYLPSGAVVMSGTCMDDDLKLQKSPGATVVEGTAIYGRHYRSSDGSVVELPAAPNAYYKFDYASKSWTDPRTAATQWPMVRAERDDKLTASDWVRIKAMDLGTPVPDTWLAYRQALRDVTLQADPFNIVWPVAP